MTRFSASDRSCLLVPGQICLKLPRFIRVGKVTVFGTSALLSATTYSRFSFVEIRLNA